MGPLTFGPKEIDGLFASPYKSYTLTADHLITGWPLGFESVQELVQVKPSNLGGLFEWLCFSSTCFECRAILILVKVP